MGKTTKESVYQDNRNALAGLLKKDADTPPPIQEVRPVESKKDVEELARISAMWVPTELARKLKIHAAESGKTIREISIEAYETYFNQISK
jgi:hypothetical protein